MYTRAEAEEIINNPNASEDELSDLVYSYMDLHKQIAMHPNASNGFLDWMKSVTTDQSVIKIIDGRLKEKPHPVATPVPEKRETHIHEESRHSKKHESAQSHRAGALNAGLTTEDLSRHTHVGEKQSPRQTIASALRSLAVAALAFLVAIGVGVISKKSDSQNADSDKATAKSAVENQIGTRLNQSQLTEDTAVAGYVDNPDGTSVDVNGVKDIIVDPYSNLMMLNNKLYLMEGNTVHPVKYGCKNCHIKDLKYGIVVASSDDDSNTVAHFWDFNTNKAIKVPGMPVEKSIFGKDLVATNPDNGPLVTYNLSGKQMVAVDKGLLYNGGPIFGEWMTFLSPDSDNTLLNLRTGKRIDNAPDLMPLKDGFVEDNSPSNRKFYDKNFKFTGQTLPDTCESFKFSPTMTIKEAADTVEKIGHKLKPGQHVCDVVAQVFVSDNGQLLFQNFKEKEFHIGSLQGPKLKSSFPLAGASVYGNYLTAEDEHGNKMSFYKFGSPDPIYTGSTPAMAIFRQLDHWLVLHNGKLSVYK